MAVSGNVEVRCFCETDTSCAITFHRCRHAFSS